MSRILTRLALSAVVVWIAASIAFLLVKSLPGDAFTELAMSPNVPPETVARLRSNYAITEPPAAQYWHWLRDAGSGDLQFSRYGNKPVATVIAEHLPATLQLMTLAFITSMLGGIALGSWQGANANTWLERFAGRVGLGIISIPDFWLAIILVWVFALTLHWVPVQGMESLTESGSFFEVVRDRLHHLVLPWLSLTLVDIAVVSRFQRASMQEVMGMQHLQSARAKGVPERSIHWKHALRVAVLPTITIAGLYFPALFVGAVLVETVFAWPGIGRVLTFAIEQRDHFLVAGIVIVGSAMTALGSLLADLIRELSDPRLRT